jgi:hypothetical protein
MELLPKSPKFEGLVTGFWLIPPQDWGARGAFQTLSQLNNLFLFLK